MENQIEVVVEDLAPQLTKLTSNWSFWLFRNDKSKKYKDNVKFISTIGSIEEFWSVYEALKPVNQISTRCSYMFFKEGIAPMWETADNSEGGRWILNVEKKYHSGSLETIWANTLVALITDQFGKESDLVNGVWVNVRYNLDVLSIWTKTATDAETQFKIGHKFKQILNLKGKNHYLTFQQHNLDEAN